MQNRGRHRRPGAGQGPVQEARCRAGGGQGGQEARWGGQLLEGGGGRAVGALGGGPLHYVALTVRLRTLRFRKQIM